MRVLLVEDELPLAEALGQILKKNKYTVDVVHNGVTGLDYALSDVYDVIILDIMLPEKDGLSVLSDLRKAGISTPILLLTALDTLSDKVNGLDRGADDYLTKPFESAELLARLRALSRRKGDILLDDILKFSDIALNLSTCELICGSKQVHLGLKELNVLKVLMNQNGRVCTKENMIERIWGFDSEAEYNNVEVYISFLRKKLASIGSNVKIKTIRGIGYALSGGK
jgi:DNA-binding response OmpR family regulator